MKFVLLILLGYGIGCIPWSYFIGKKFGNLDVRQHGSGNAGATNVLRTVGKKAALFAVLGDISKGLISAIIGHLLIGAEGAFLGSTFAVIGHCYPVTAKFKGGKGVATAGGMIFGTNPVVGFALLIYMILTVKITKYVSLASVTSAVIYPILTWFTYDSWIIRGCSLFLGLFVIYKHKANIKRLLSKEESKTTLFDK